LAFLSRTEAKANVERQGGDASESISKSTDIVVVGGELYNEYKQTGKTTGKLAKAVQLIQSGAPIDIIGESEFMDMIR
jgi:DNA polymerase-3 subunit epsilon